MTNKIGVNLMVWSGQVSQTELALFPAIQAMGYDGVELPIFDAKSLNIDAVHRVLAQSALECTVSTALPEGVNLVDQELADQGIAYLRTIIEVAAELGSHIVCGPLALPVGERRGRGYTEAEWRNCVQSLRRLSVYAETLGVTLAFEPLNRFETFLLNTVADGIRLCEEVDMAHLGLLLDTFHMHIEEKSTPDAIHTASGFIKHFHASENDRGVVGSGQVPWTSVLASLRQTGYDGWVVVESFNAVIAELAGATCVWRPLAENPESLARRKRGLLAKLRKGIALGMMFVFGRRSPREIGDQLLVKKLE